MAALSLINSGACLDDDDEPEFIDPPADAFARDVLRAITARADIIGRAPDGRAFLLLEPEQDDDADAESSASPIHPIDRPSRTAGRSANR